LKNVYKKINKKANFAADFLYFLHQKSKQETACFCKFIKKIIFELGKKISTSED